MGIIIMIKAFSHLTVYGGWNEFKSEPWAAHEAATVVAMKVEIDPEYGKLVVRTEFADGSYQFLPLSPNSKLKVGDTMNPYKTKTVYLRKGTMESRKIQEIE